MGYIMENSGTAFLISGTASPNPGTALQDSGTRELVLMSESGISDDPMDLDEPVPLCMVRPAPKWGQPIMSYLEDGSLPNDEISARQIQRRSKAYTIFQGELHKRSVTTVLQRCVEPEEGEEILQEIHQGECGHHASSRAQIGRAHV